MPPPPPCTLNSPHHGMDRRDVDNERTHHGTAVRRVPPFTTISVTRAFGGQSFCFPPKFLRMFKNETGQVSRNWGRFWPPLPSVRQRPSLSWTLTPVWPATWWYSALGHFPFLWKRELCTSDSKMNNTQECMTLEHLNWTICSLLKWFCSKKCLLSWSLFCGVQLFITPERGLKWENEKRDSLKSEWDTGVSVPGAFKLNHLQPVQLI